MSGYPTRRAFLASAVVLPALAGLAAVTPAVADASKSSQASMHYQTTPNDGKQCSGCNFFIPGSSCDRQRHVQDRRRVDLAQRLLHRLYPKS